MGHLSQYQTLLFQQSPLADVHTTQLLSSERTKPGFVVSNLALLWCNAALCQWLDPTLDRRDMFSCSVKR